MKRAGCTRAGGRDLSRRLHLRPTPRRPSRPRRRSAALRPPPTSPRPTAPPTSRRWSWARSRCGFLTVPEDRAAAGNDVRLFVARIEPPEVLHDDPMFVAGTDLANLPNYGGIAPLAQRVGREVILMDTRGVGHSEPSLACPEVDEIRATTLATATDDEQTRTTFLDAVAACHERLTADGVDLSAYHLSAMAADAEDLRTALGIEEWNVVSYGTASRIALEMVRQSPDHVRSVLLDSPEVPGADPRLLAVDSTRDSLAAVLAACASDPGCDDAFPDAETLLDRALTALADDPITVEMTAPGQEPVDVLVDDALLLRLLRGMLSDGGSSGSFMRADRFLRSWRAPPQDASTSWPTRSPRWSPARRRTAWATCPSACPSTSPASAPRGRCCATTSHRGTTRPRRRARPARR